MTTTIQPGTRCECDGSCQNKPHTFECADAARMVTVLEIAHRYTNCRYKGQIGYGQPHRIAKDDEQVTCPECRIDLGLPSIEVPMCEPCAAYHEAKAETPRS